jgi:ABC-type sugar transport system, periplasmic component
MTRKQFSSDRKSTAKKHGAKDAGARFRLMVGAGGLAAAILLCLSCFIFLKPLSIVGIGLSAKEAAAFRAGLAGAKGIPSAKLTTIPRDNKGLPALAAKADILVFHPFKSDKAELTRLAPLARSLNRRFFPAIVGDFSGYAVLPLLIDHAELSYDSAAFMKAGLAEPKTLDLLEKAAAELKNGAIPPIAIEGGDDRVLLAFIANLVLNEGGPAAYDRLASRLAAGDPIEKLASPGSPAGPELSRALARIKDWTAKAYLSRNWLDMKDIDVKALVENFQVPAFITFLSAHRLYDSNALLRYTTVEFPSAAGQSGTCIIAPLLAAGVPRSSLRKIMAMALLSKLSSPEANMSLASQSGEAPCISAAGSPDIQARDVRSLALGAGRIIQGLDADGFSTPDAAAGFCAQLRLLIRNTAMK